MSEVKYRDGHIVENTTRQIDRKGEIYGEVIARWYGFRSMNHGNNITRCITRGLVDMSEDWEKVRRESRIDLIDEHID